MFGIFKIGRIIRQLKNGTFSSKEFAVEEATDTLKGVFVLPFIINGALVVVAFLLGWTDLFAVSSWVGKLVFFVLLIPLIIQFALYKIAKGIIAKLAEKAGGYTLSR